MESSKPQAPDAVTPGDLLRAARERLGYSPREMADRLNWMPAYVTAVEENRFDALRGDAFVRGYLRAYARQVDLSEDDIVHAYDALQPAGRDARDSKEANGAGVSGSGPGLTILVGIVVALLVVAGLWWSQEEPSQGKTRPAATPVETAAAAPPAQLPETTSEVEVEPEPEPSESSVEIAAETVADVDTDADSDAGADSEPTLALVEAPAVEDDSELSLLEFSFKGDCWVEVRDGNATLIYADLRADGDEFRLKGVPPFEVLLGDANVVQLRHQGESFPIRTRPGRVLARFSVGQP